MARYVLGYRFVKKGFFSNDRYADLPCSDYSYAGLYDSYDEADAEKALKLASDRAQNWDTVYEIFSEDEWDSAHS
jgi:hypothetical protein